MASVVEAKGSFLKKPKKSIRSAQFFAEDECWLWSLPVLLVLSQGFRKEASSLTFFLS
jgi:hypothetical protein